MSLSLTTTARKNANLHPPALYERLHNSQPSEYSIELALNSSCLEGRCGCGRHRRRRSSSPLFAILSSSPSRSWSSLTTLRWRYRRRWWSSKLLFVKQDVRRRCRGHCRRRRRRRCRRRRRRRRRRRWSLWPFRPCEATRDAGELSWAPVLLHSATTPILHMPTHSFTLLPTNSLTHSFTHSLIHSRLYALTNSFTHWMIQSISQCLRRSYTLFRCHLLNQSHPPAFTGVFRSSLEV